jgi:hypothetical protein
VSEDTYKISGGYNVPLAANPFNSWATVLDCGDIPVRLLTTEIAYWRSSKQYIKTVESAETVEKYLS